MKKLSCNSVLNMAVTFLLTAVLLCWNVVQVEASVTFEPYDVNILCRDSLISAKLISGVEGGTYNNFYYETVVQLNTEPFEPGYTYRSDNNIELGYWVTYVNTSATRDISVLSDIKEVKVSLSDGREYNVDFYYNEQILETVAANSTKRVGRSVIIQPAIDDYYTSVWNDIIITITLEHEVNCHIDVFEPAIYVESSNATLTTYRTPGDYTYSVGNEISGKLDTTIEQNNTLLSRLTSWFEDLFKRMDEEQDELLNGYQDTTTSEAASAFSSESDKLTALEGELSTQSNTYVSDYAAEGFDLGVLATIRSSLVFVTTWFTNFWNMGGVFTAGLNFCFALYIVFFILRFKR